MAELQFPVKVRKGDDVREANNPSALVQWRYRGYTLEKTGELIPAQAPFDPSEHSAAEVNAYLLAADTAEYERVAQLEKDGKNRSSALPA
jgi:hypothetical protein